MKVDKIIFISDSNINYLSFWNRISRFYKEFHNIDCKLFFLAKDYQNNKHFLSEKFGEVEIVEPIENIPIIIQTLWAKFWFTQTELETTWLIGDIDLFLLNKRYLNFCLDNMPAESYGHLNANGYKNGNWWNNELSGIPGYFHCAKGKKFKEFLNLSDSFEDDCKYIFNSKKYGILYNGLINKEEQAPERVKDKKDYGFICCEENRTTELLKSKKDQIFSFTYPESLIRIETPFAKNGLQTPDEFDLKTLFNPSLKNTYIDFHCPRPFFKFENDINFILDHYE